RDAQDVTGADRVGVVQMVSVGLEAAAVEVEDLAVASDVAEFVAGDLRQSLAGTDDDLLTVGVAVVWQLQNPSGPQETRVLERSAVGLTNATVELENLEIGRAHV